MKIKINIPCFFSGFFPLKSVRNFKEKSYIYVKGLLWLVHPVTFRSLSGPPSGALSNHLYPCRSVDRRCDCHPLLLPLQTVWPSVSLFLAT